MEQTLIDNGFKHIRTFGNKKEYEKTLGNHKMRVRPAQKKVLITCEHSYGIRKDMENKRVTKEEAVQLIVAFSVMAIIYA